MHNNIFFPSAGSTIPSDPTPVCKRSEAKNSGASDNNSAATSGAKQKKYPRHTLFIQVFLLNLHFVLHKH